MRENSSEEVPELPKGSYCRDMALFPSSMPCPHPCSVPKLLLALMQGMGPNHSCAGLSALEEQQPPSPCWGHHRISHAAAKSLMSCFMRSPKAAEQRGPCEVEPREVWGCSGRKRMPEGLWTKSALCIPGMLPLSLVQIPSRSRASGSLL